MKVRAIALSAMLTLAVSLMAAPTAQAAGRAQRILFFGPSLTTGNRLNEAHLARSVGYDIRVADADRWASLTTEDFASYQAIIVGDPHCGYPYEGEDYLAPVLANRDTWSAAVNGPVIVAGLDPMYHQRKAGAVDFTNNAISYAASGGSTGMYFSLSCYFFDARGGTNAKVLRGLGDFEVGGIRGDCDDLRVSMPAHPAMAGITDASVSNWHCAAHERFDSYPGDWVKLIGQRDTHKAIVIARGELV